MNVMERVTEWVDALVMAVAPGVGLLRQAQRHTAKRIDRRHAFRANFNDGAKSDRSWWSRPGTSGSADADLLDDLPRLRERSRERYANDPFARALVDATCDNVVGCGLRPVLHLDHQALGIDVSQAEELERTAEALWEEWGATADSAGRLTIAELQSLVFSQWMLNGDVGVVPVMVQDARVMSRLDLKLEVIEADRIESPNRSDTKMVRSGVALGARGQPIGYWVLPQHPGDMEFGQRSDPKYISAHQRDGRPNFLHIYQQERAGQSRGRPLLATVLGGLKDREDYIQARITAANVAACFALAITKNMPEHPGVPLLTQTDGTRIEQLEFGQVNYLAPGEKVEAINPQVAGEDFGAFLRSLERRIAAAIGLPYESVTRDYTGSNYSQTKGARADATKTFQRLQKRFVGKFLQRVWVMVLEEAWLRGLWPAGDFYERKDLWTRTQWIGDGYGWIEPQREVAAYRELLDLGLTTRTAVARMVDGSDWEHDIAPGIAREREVMRRLGIDKSEDTEDMDGETDDGDPTEDDQE